MRDVPEDEAQEVRDLLAENDIEFFETFAGNWGISLPALWLNRNDQYELARVLLDEYQNERSVRVRKEFELRRENGESNSLWQSFQATPFRFTAFLSLATLVLYISAQLFLSL